MYRNLPAAHLSLMRPVVTPEGIPVGKKDGRPSGRSRLSSAISRILAARRARKDLLPPPPEEKGAAAHEDNEAQVEWALRLMS